MKKLLAFALLGCTLMTATVQAQSDKSKRPSPPATVTQTISSGATITINYSQPSLKGRTIGQNLDPMKDKVWRMGANEATTFETDKDIYVEGEILPAGKYSLFGMVSDNGFTVFFNKATNIWGTQYDEKQNQLAATVKPAVAADLAEKLTYTIDKNGTVSLFWGNLVIPIRIR